MVARQILVLLVGVQILPRENANSLLCKELAKRLKTAKSGLPGIVHLSCIYFLTRRDAMARTPKPFTVRKRNDSRTFQITLNPSCCLPVRVCQEWMRRSFQDFPDELVQYRNPKSKTAAEAAALALIKYPFNYPRQQIRLI